jgi:hypothetical protein
MANSESGLDNTMDIVRKCLDDTTNLDLTFMTKFVHKCVQVRNYLNVNIALASKCYYYKSKLNLNLVLFQEEFKRPSLHIAQNCNGDHVL